MKQTIDSGARCDRHVGEVFPPRCVDCGQEGVADHHPLLPGVYTTTQCPAHAGYYLPCDRCARDREDTP